MPRPVPYDRGGHLRRHRVLRQAGDVEGHAAGEARVEAVGAVIAVHRALGQHVAARARATWHSAPRRRRRCAGARALRCRARSRRTRRRSSARCRRRGPGPTWDRRRPGPPTRPAPRCCPGRSCRRRPGRCPRRASSGRGGSEPRTAGAALHPRAPSTAINAASLRIGTTLPPPGRVGPIRTHRLACVRWASPAAPAQPAASGFPVACPASPSCSCDVLGASGEGPSSARSARAARGAGLALLGVLVARLALAGVFGGDGVVALFGHGVGLPISAPRKPPRAQSGSSGTARPWSRPRSTARVMAAVP